MAIDYVKLRDELLTDPLARGYSGMTRAQKVVSLNTKDREQDKDAPTSVWDIQTTIPASQQLAWQSHADTTAILYLKRFEQMLQVDKQVKPDAPPITTWFNYLRGLASPPITAGTRNDIRALGKELVSRVVELRITFGEDITEGAIKHVEERM